MADVDFNLTKQNLLNTFLYYEGNLYWKISRTNKTKAGMLAGNKHKYCKVYFNNKRYLLHRIIFMMFHGYMPDQVDHIDGNPHNNCIENLRSVDNIKNQYNAKLSIKNTTGYKNVHWNKNIKKWSVQLRANKKNIFVGYFENLELASLVAQEARAKYHEQFARNL